ncbi:MAG: McrB family protein [Polaromonas sp.]
MKSTDAVFESLLNDYVSAFVARVSSSSTSQVPIPVTADFSHQCEKLGIWFKTSFGHGSLAEIPWLACFAPGQSAKLAGVYPVLMYQRSTGTVSVSYGESATAVETAGIWPRHWPENLTTGLLPFGTKKKQYKKSFVSQQFNSPLTPQVSAITNAFLKIIQNFLLMKDTLLPGPQFDESALTAFHEDSNDAGLAFSENTHKRLTASLLTKRFTILTGLAGSGKTKLAEAFAIWLAESADQYQIVAVGADWTSNENLLGYADALREGAYQMPVNGALELILRASANLDKPYFLILDEMNLSHVERYFADFLSAMESRNSKLRLHGVGAGLKAGETFVPHELALPNNLFIIGTVNVDETTYMFSPKVLDRANVIEFRATTDQMDAFLDDPANIDLEALQAQGAGFAQAFVQRANADTDVATLIDATGNAYGPRLKQDLLALFTTLAGVGAEFGFRSAKEIARFMVIHQELSGPGWQYAHALDAQVLQKLMPKLHGSARKLDDVLKALDAFAEAKGLALTREKVNRMQDRLKRDGFTSFAEA